MTCQPAINTYGYLWSAPIQECLARLASRGYREFEGVINPPHLDLELSAAARHELLQFMEGEGLSFVSLNLPSLDTNLASPFTLTRQYSVQMFKKAIVLASELRAPYLVTVPGRLNPLLPPDLDVRRQWVQDAVGELIPFARDHGVGLAIENVPFAALPTAALIRDFLTVMGNNDVLSVCYDVANGHYIGESPLEALEMLSDHITLLHCSDTTRQTWRHDPVGLGDVPFDELAQALSQFQYSGSRLLEIIHEDTENAIVSSHRLLAECGVLSSQEAHQ